MNYSIYIKSYITIRINNCKEYFRIFAVGPFDVTYELAHVENVVENATIEVANEHVTKQLDKL